MGGEYGLLKVLFVYCGPIGWLLWLISFATIALIVKFFLGIRRGTILPAKTLAHLREQVEGRKFEEAIAFSGGDRSYLAAVVHSALTEAPYGYPAMERAMEETAEQETTRLYRRVEWLNLIGNIGPMLGLMGTVMGMINVFFTIVKKGGNPNPSDLAEGIGTALVTTLLGLAVAIPSLAVYAVLRNIIDAVSSEAVVASQELIDTFRPARKPEQDS